MCKLAGCGGWGNFFANLGAAGGRKMGGNFSKSKGCKRVENGNFL